MRNTTSGICHFQEFNVTNDLQMNGEFTVYIHMAFPKVSNWFALLPKKFASGAEVKITLLGSTVTEEITVPEQPDTGAEIVVKPLHVLVIVGSYTSSSI